MRRALQQPLLRPPSLPRRGLMLPLLQLVGGPGKQPPVLPSPLLPPLLAASWAWQ